MAGLGEVVRRLVQREGVEAVLVLSADGLPIEHASHQAFEPEPLAALTSTLAQYATRLGLGAGRGALRTAVLEYERGLLVVAQIGGGRLPGCSGEIRSQRRRAPVRPASAPAGTGGVVVGGRRVSG